MAISPVGISAIELRTANLTGAAESGPSPETLFWPMQSVEMGAIDAAREVNAGRLSEAFSAMGRP